MLSPEHTEVSKVCAHLVYSQPRFPQMESHDLGIHKSFDQVLQPELVEE